MCFKHFEILVEEPSAEEALKILLPKILSPEITYNIHAFQGKSDLFKKLPFRLRGYRNWLPEDWGIVILFDEDRANCISLKQKAEEIAGQAGFYTKRSPDSRGRFQVVTRLCIEELEAWFMGDNAALCAAYPGVSPNLAKQRAYRNPDAIAGGTWEALERVLQRAGYHQGGLAKTQAARDISTHMIPESNTSPSFQFFCHTLRLITVA